MKWLGISSDGGKATVSGSEDNIYSQVAGHNAWGRVLPSNK